jgi:hypothetical protein
MPLAHAKGRYLHPEVERLEAEGRVVFRYVDASGGETAAAHPNGSLHNIAGVTNAAGNVVGLMPHPERAAEMALGGTDGRMIFESLLVGRAAAARVISHQVERLSAAQVPARSRGARFAGGDCPLRARAEALAPGHGPGDRPPR